ncbi:MAG: hypothetical protein QNJ15_00895 [Erythrobacter sp.]|nr:hypothetical protein [Erythrobacter sp.]
MPASPFDELAGTDPSVMLFAQAKFTYIWAQNEPVRSVLFSVYTCAPDISLFSQSHTDVHYANDTLDAVGTFTLKHADFGSFLGQLARTIDGGTGTGDWASISVMPDLREPTTHEALLGREATEDLIERFVAEIDRDHAVAELVLRDFQKGP